MPNNSKKEETKDKQKVKKSESKNSKNMSKAKYDDMRQVDWSYFGPGYFD